MSRDRATGSKMSPSEEFTDLFEWGGAMLQGNAQRTGNDVIEAGQFRGTVRALHTQEDIGGLLVIMDADVEGVRPGDLDFLCDVLATSGEWTTRSGLSYIGH